MHDIGHPPLRNPYDLVYTTARRLYATDNGPNLGFGPASIGAVAQLPDPEDADELLLQKGQAGARRVRLDDAAGTSCRRVCGRRTVVG